MEQDFDECSRSYNYTHSISSSLCIIGSKPENVHVVVDNHLVTGQNIQSTLTAVQNLILISNAR